MAVSKQENKVCDCAGFHRLPLHNDQFLSGFFSVYIVRNVRFVWFVWGEQLWCGLLRSAQKAFSTSVSIERLMRVP